MLKTVLAILVGPLAMALVAQGRSPNELKDLLQQAEIRRQEYIETFKALAAVETKVTEIIDAQGRTDRQRTVVSDFLVYQSSLSDEGVAEFRIAREVDGRAVGNPAE